jgi:predicted methyltransferase
MTSGHARIHARLLGSASRPNPQERTAMQRTVVPLLLAASLAAATAAAATHPSGKHAMHGGAIPAYIQAAVDDPVRSEDREKDARRHGAELVAFSGVKPGDDVLELIPGSGYFTRIFSKVVGPKGHVYTVTPQPMEKYADDTKKLPDTLKNVNVAIQPADQLTVPKPVDIAFTSQNYHDYPDKFMGPTDPAALNKAVFAALKPGGTYIVIDHVAQAGSGTRDTDTLHRIDPALVKQQVEAAGFEYVGESDVLRNPADDHTLKVFDPTVRGHTDQFAYKFRKPKGAK